MNLTEEFGCFHTKTHRSIFVAKEIIELEFLKLQTYSCHLFNIQKEFIYHDKINGVFSKKCHLSQNVTHKMA